MPKASVEESSPKWIKSRVQHVYRHRDSGRYYVRGYRQGDNPVRAANRSTAAVFSKFRLILMAVIYSRWQLKASINYTVQLRCEIFTILHNLSECEQDQTHIERDVEDSERVKTRC
jgi:hypothetical protein